MTASGEIVGNLDSNGYRGETKRIMGEIPGPTFVYLRGISLDYRGKDDDLRNNVIEWYMRNLVYVDLFGQNDIEETLMCQKARCMCRYHMRYARGWAPFGDRWVTFQLY